MREIIHDQLPIVPIQINHQYARELDETSRILDRLPRAAQLVYADLTRGVSNPNMGRMGMTADQVMRTGILKQTRQFSYEELAFNIADSRTYKTFVGYGIGDEPPSVATLKRNIKCVRPQTWEQINRMIVEYARKKNIEKGTKIRFDCTVTDSNIHEPTDSWLLWDCVRVLCRDMERAKESFGIEFTDHTRRAKRRHIGIAGAKDAQQRNRLYKDLLMVTLDVVEDAERMVVQLGNVDTIDIGDMLKANAYEMELRQYIELSMKVVEQTVSRVIHEEQLPADQKIVSIFEPHTDIIIKDRREVQFGHKVILSNGASGLITDCIVLEGNPADSTLAVDMVKRHIKNYGIPPKKACFDGGFASGDNLKAIKGLGVEDVVFSKRRGLSIEDMAKSTWVYKSMKKFRAGIEGIISFLKRCFGLGRCTWRGHESFKSYVWSSIVSVNLLLIARRSLA